MNTWPSSFHLELSTIWNYSQLRKVRDSLTVQALCAGTDSAPTIAKALYRRAIARVAVHEEELAESDLKEALTIVPGDEACQRELARVQEVRRAKREKEKKMFKGLFAQ